MSDNIFRTITYKYIKENFAAVHVELTPKESQHIHKLVEKAWVFGDQWPETHRLTLFADTPPPKGRTEEKKVVTEVIDS